MSYLTSLMQITFITFEVGQVKLEALREGELAQGN